MGTVLKILCVAFEQTVVKKLSLMINGDTFPGGGALPQYNGLYREALPKRGTFFKLQVYKRVGIS